MNADNIQPVLYAEDDENDVFLMERAFDKVGVRYSLKAVPDGKHAIAYLSGTPPYTDPAENPLPALVLVDLSMPGTSGHDVLQWVRSQPRLSEIPVIVLTSSNQESDIHRAYLMGASGYMIKPGDPDELLRIVKAIDDKWLSGKKEPVSFTDLSAFRPAPGKN
jgi:CheY-like chemotaxis protein